MKKTPMEIRNDEDRITVQARGRAVEFPSEADAKRFVKEATFAFRVGATRMVGEFEWHYHQLFVAE